MGCIITVNSLNSFFYYVSSVYVSLGSGEEAFNVVFILTCNICSVYVYTLALSFTT